MMIRTRRRRRISSDLAVRDIPRHVDYYVPPNHARFVFGNTDNQRFLFRSSINGDTFHKLSAINCAHSVQRQTFELEILFGSELHGRRRS